LPSSVASAGEASASTITPTAPSPTSQPSTTQPVHPGLRRDQHQNHGDDRHRAQRDTDGERQDLSYRLAHVSDADDAAEPRVRHRGVDRLRLSRRRPVVLAGTFRMGSETF
jgi:hypothetical protein